MLALATSGCGGSDSAPRRAVPSPPAQALHAAARSLATAMAASHQSIAAARGTRSSLDRLGALLGPTLLQTTEVAELIAPAARGSAPTGQLVLAARDQARYLRAVRSAARAPTRAVATRALTQAAQAAEAATGRYRRLTLLPGVDLAGDLPPGTAFDVDPLRAAVGALRY